MKKENNVFLKSRVPLYLQVARLIRKKIESQEWPFGHQIPTLKLLEQEYQVSRITLRSALSQLEECGIILRKRGLGTFVSKDLSKQRWFKLPSHFDEIIKMTQELGVKFLSIEKTDYEFTVDSSFGEILPNYQRFRRVHYYQELPYCILDVYLDNKIFDSDPASFEEAPIILQLLKRPDVHVANAQQTLRIMVSDENTAKHLNMGVGDPIADVCRVLTDENQCIFYYVHIQYPAQMIQIDTDLLQGVKIN